MIFRVLRKALHFAYADHAITIRKVLLASFYIGYLSVTALFAIGAIHFVKALLESQGVSTLVALGACILVALLAVVSSLLLLGTGVAVRERWKIAEEQVILEIEAGNHDTKGALSPPEQEG